MNKLKENKAHVINIKQKIKAEKNVYLIQNNNDQVKNKESTLDQ